MAEFVNLYQVLKDAGAELDSHESDLYAKATPEVLAIVEASGWSYSRFISQIDGQQWLDLPFAFYPWWENRQAKAVQS